MVETKHIKIIQVDSRDLVYFKISEQSHRGLKFGRHGTIDFEASNGIKLSSLDCPEWRPSLKTLFVRGSFLNRDDEIIICDAYYYDLICEAVKEYNTVFMGINIILDKELFEI